MTDDRQELEFEIDAPREAVWRALTDAEALKGWFASEASVDLRPGGDFTLAHGEWSETSRIEEVVPNERLRLVKDATVREFVLEGREGTTILRIVESGFGHPEMYESHDQGWKQYVKTLRHYLARHADEAAAGTYVHWRGGGTVVELREALQRALPAESSIVDDTERTLGARVPELGDGVFQGSVEGTDEEAFVWVHLVAYGDALDQLPRIEREVEAALEAAVQQS